MLIFGFVELSGFILLSVQAHLPQLRPPPCNMISEEEHCTEATGFKATVFFLALYLVAVGSGCLKPNMISHGADQFRNHDPDQSRKLSTYFNAAYFSFCAGELVALTVLVWVQTRSGMDVGFGVSAGAMAMVLAILISGAFFYRNRPPHGSIFMPLARVSVAAFTKRKQVCPSIDPRVLERGHFNSPHQLDADDGGLRHTTMFRFLDKACVRAQDGSNAKESPWRLCTAAEVEQVKTLSVQQGSAMDTQLTGSFHVPPASLQSIPYVVLLVLVPIYETTFVPLARKLTGNSTGITPLQRIGVGLFTVALPGFLIFGLSEMFTAVGLIEFFYKQSVAGMQSFLTAMTYCSYSFGFYLSSLLVSMVNKITSLSSSRGWLSDNDLNKDRLDLFYWLLAALSLLNFFNYLYWCRWYSKGQPASMNPPPPPPPDDSQHSFCSSKHAGAEVHSISCER
ncbi:Peptide transporter [Musa troglodytarum]|uniref:Peptide transporter n=1 Tax=Musa troglodytarum TaxID=320322 RepID=A0A9E7HBT6_9LILI|nr:Peptide transporter [Musa troglodytarum]